MMLYYNPILEEMFVIKRGVLKGWFLLETSFGTTLFKTLPDLLKSTTIVEDSIVVDKDF